MGLGSLSATAATNSVFLFGISGGVGLVELGGLDDGTWLR